MPAITCHSCDAPPFANYKDLALHIMRNKNGHRKGRRWAAKFLSINTLSPAKRVDRKKSQGGLTEGDRENRRSTVRELSGKTKFVTTLCPRCKVEHPQYLPEEFVSAPLAWRIGEALAVTCGVCGSRRNFASFGHKMRTKVEV